MSTELQMLVGAIAVLALWCLILHFKIAARQAANKRLREELRMADEFHQVLERRVSQSEDRIGALLQLGGFKRIQGGPTRWERGSPKSKTGVLVV